VPFLLDTNILLRLAEPHDTDYSIVRHAIDTFINRGEDLCYAAQNLVEFWNVCTRPVTRNGFGLSFRKLTREPKPSKPYFASLPMENPCMKSGGAWWFDIR
jgi:hypothetical protein